MRERFWHGWGSLALAAGLAVVALISAIGAVQASGGGGRGEGHTPVTICHWVPAHGGSFVVITVDDDGLNGHGEQHENDVIPASDDCEDEGDKTAVSTKTHAPKTKTIVVTQTTAPATTTPAATNTSTAVATQTSTSTPLATQTVVGGLGPGPDLTPDATNTSVAVASSTSTPEGDEGADTATPEGVDGEEALDEDDDGEGGVFGESVAPQGGGAEALPESGTGFGSSGNDAYRFSLAALAFAALAGASMLLLRRRLSL
ncbi:MAG: hypothetical protein WD359_04385 [Dehalococcoidia bacterium]